MVGRLACSALSLPRQCGARSGNHVSMLTVPELAELDYRKSLLARSHIFTLPGLCRHYCPWKCASGRPMSAVIVTGRV